MRNPISISDCARCARIVTNDLVKTGMKKLFANCRIDVNIDYNINFLPTQFNASCILQYSIHG
jgi:hypothetical protein